MAYPYTLQRIITGATPRPGMPNIFGPNAMKDYSGCLFASDFLTSGDQSDAGAGYRLLGTPTFTTGGILLPGGESGLSIGLVAPTTDFTIIIAAKAAADAAADGYFVSSLDTTLNVGAGIRYTISGTSITGQVQQASGAVLSTGGISRALDTWFIVAFRTSSAPTSTAAFILSNTSQTSTSGLLGARNAPSRSFRIGDGWSTTKGVKGTLGGLAIYNALKSQSEMAAMIATMRAEMLSKHSVTIP